MTKSPPQAPLTALTSEFLHSRNLTLHKLNVFCMIARYSSVTRTAERLNIAQPAVTSHLRSLEDSLGTQLVRKTGRNIELTQAGERVYSWATEVMQRSSEMLLDLADIKKGVLGQTKIAAAMVVGTYKLPDIIIRFHKEYPAAKVCMSMSSPHLATQAVLSGDCDFGVTLIDPTQDTSRLETELLWKEPLFLVAALDSTLVGDVATLSELASLPFVTPMKGQIARELIDEALRTAGVVRTNSVLEFGHPEPILAAIRADIGPGFVFQSALPADLEREGLRIVRTPGIELTMPLFLIYDRKTVFSAPQTDLIDRIRRTFAALQDAPA
ncbi:LysR family transcriptional regulator [Celeribacter indicus]|uniref:LysR family transcriptional regulator n=1 Tax=Celeribacter indicus TaxID=1208324 RepID=A0A0B5DVM8_9RHOB|nr:LysR family transcriptional regulator [Celeribacter indicus]AJE45210.1 LysR family transcriptional regulator [Celeribacter indicus]SDX45381.1 DNA-binding transcriptional regulator, LysR family [Celeribacter indicus]